MSLKEVHSPHGVVWQVRWLGASLFPKSRDFGEKQEAEAFYLETRERRLRVLTQIFHWFTIVVTAIVFGIGVFLVLDARHRRAVPGDFTRVGGATRVETAVEASRFWLRRPKLVVRTGAH